VRESEKVAVGSAHGRFQPLHLGHLEYLVAAKQRCEFMWVGITQYLAPALQATTPEDLHRALPQNNPLTFFERADILRVALSEAGVPGGEYAVTPFPIEEPSLLPNFLDLGVHIFTTVYDDWNRHKIDVLRGRGYQVSILWERDVKQYAGVEVRRSILEGDGRWREMVSPATAAKLDDLGIDERLRNLEPVTPPSE
jgi:nicotinamide mononucleotide adenylyltransferase